MLLPFNLCFTKETFPSIHSLHLFHYIWKYFPLTPCLLQVTWPFLIFFFCFIFCFIFYFLFFVFCFLFFFLLYSFISEKRGGACEKKVGEAGGQRENEARFLGDKQHTERGRRALFALPFLPTDHSGSGACWSIVLFCSALDPAVLFLSIRASSSGLACVGISICRSLLISSLFLSPSPPRSFFTRGSVDQTRNCQKTRSSSQTNKPKVVSQAQAAIPVIVTIA